MSKILIIDDDKDVLFAAEQYLQKNNEDVFTATGGSQGLRVLKQETIDCIVLDVLLKGESGFDLCRKIYYQTVFSGRAVSSHTGKDTAVLSNTLQTEDFEFFPTPDQSGCQNHTDSG